MKKFQTYRLFFSLLYSLSIIPHSSFSQDPPVTIYLKDRPAPQTISIPLTPDQANGKKYLAPSGRDTIERTREILLKPLETIYLPVLKNSNGEPILDKDGNPFILGDYGGSSSMQQFTIDNGLALDVIACGFMDKRGNLWFGTYGGGVSKYDGKSFINFTTVQGLANNVVYSTTEDKTGNLWFGTYGGGVSKYDPRQDVRADGKSFTNYTTAQGLANKTVWSITEDKTGNLWFGTEGGISKYDPRQDVGAGGKSFTNFTTADGLPDNVVTQIVAYSDKLYIGTNSGICELIPSPTSPKGFIVGATYNSSTGYPVKDVNIGQNAMYLTKKGFPSPNGGGREGAGVIWIGTGSDKTGLVRFDPSALHKNTEPPCVVIQSVKVNEENICWYNMSMESGVRSSEKKNLRQSAQSAGDTMNDNQMMPEGQMTLNDSAALSLAMFHAFGKPVSKDVLDEQKQKFRHKQLESILVSTAHLEINEQRNILEKTFLSWKGDIEQVDDVTIIGIRL